MHGQTTLKLLFIIQIIDTKLLPGYIVIKKNLRLDTIRIYF